MRRFVRLLPGVCLLGFLLTCGEKPPPTGPAVNPDTIAASVVVSQDSAVVEVGSGLVVRAQARNASGVWIAQAAITWVSDTEAVATVAGGTIRAVGVGSARITARAGTGVAVVRVRVPPPVTSIQLSPRVDTLVELTSERTVSVLALAGTQAREGAYSVISRSTGVATASYSSSRHAVVVGAVRRGTAVIVVTEAAGAADSVTVVVALRATRLTAPEERTGYVGRGAPPAYTAFDANGDAVPGVRPQFESSDTTVVRVDSLGAYSYQAVGSAVVTARLPGGPKARTFVKVLATPPLRLPFDSLTTGVGQVVDSQSVGAGADTIAWVRLRALDTAIVLAPDSVLLGQRSLRLVARSVGTTRVIATAPGFVPDTMPVRVTPTKLLVAPYETTTRVPVHQQYFVGVGYTDLAGVRRPLAVTTTVSLLSRDTMVLRLDPGADRVTFYAGTYGGGGIPGFHTIAPGTAWLVAQGAGFQTDSLQYTVDSGPRAAFVPTTRRYVVGVGQRSGGPTGVQPSLGTTLGFNRSSDVTLYITQRHPEVAQVPESLLVPRIATVYPFDVRGLKPGVDTVVASAPGFDADTLQLVVTPLRILLDGSPGTSFASGAGSGGVGLMVGDTAGTTHLPALDIPFLATTSNPAVADPPVRIAMPSGWPAAWPLSFGVRDTGQAVVTVRDSAGYGGPLALPVTVVLDTTLVLTHPGLYPPTLGFRQRSLEREYYAGRGAGVFDFRKVAYLSSSDPGLLQVPDSVAILDHLNSIYFGPLAAGGRAGTAIITATARGYRATHMEVMIGAPRFELWTSNAIRLGTRVRLYVRLLDPAGVERPTDEDVTVTLSLPDGGATLGAGAATVLAGRSRDSTTLQAELSGMRRVVASDARGLPYAYLPDTLRTSADDQQIRIWSPSAYGTVPQVGVTLVDTVLVHRTPPAAGSPVVSIQHLGRSLELPTAVTIPDGELWGSLVVRGASLGTDTLMATATGFAGDTMRVEVVLAQVVLEGLSPTLRLGDSAAVRLVVRNPRNQPRAAAVPVTFELGTSGLAMSDGTRTVSTVTVSAGSSASPVFYVRGTATGTGTLMADNVLFAPLTATVIVTAQGGS